jgi:hypothetical protein
MPSSRPVRGSVAASSTDRAAEYRLRRWRHASLVAGGLLAAVPGDSRTLVPGCASGRMQVFAAGTLLSSKAPEARRSPLAARDLRSAERSREPRRSLAALRRPASGPALAVSPSASAGSRSRRDGITIAESDDDLAEMLAVDDRAWSRSKTARLLLRARKQHWGGTRHRCDRAGSNAHLLINGGPPLRESGSALGLGELPPADAFQQPSGRVSRRPGAWLLCHWWGSLRRCLLWPRRRRKRSPCDPAGPAAERRRDSTDYAWLLHAVVVA